MKRGPQPVIKQQAWKKRKTTTKPPLAVQALVPARPLAFQQNTVSSGPEKKNFDVDLTLVNAIATPIGSQDWSPTITLLNGIAQGATETTRVGRKCQLVKISANWTALIPPAATGGCSLRFRIVYDKQTNGAAPTIAQVFAVNNYHSANNLANSDRFITLVDEITPPLSIQGDTQVSGKFSRRLGLETMFSAAPGVVASITSGSMYLFVSQSGGALNSSPNLNLYVRTRFIDI